MARIFNNSIWSRKPDGSPIKMGDLTVTPEQTLFNYTDEYRASELPGMALLASPKAWGGETVEFKTREGFPVHPRLMSIIPGEGRRNIQRKIFARMLQKMGKPSTPGFETDWEMALMAGVNTIGHLFLFRNDQQAADWFDRPAEQGHIGTRSRFWKMLRDDITLDHVAFDPDVISKYIGPTPTAGGMIPKLLVSIHDPGDGMWDGKIARPGMAGHLDVILKIEPSDYRDVLELEKCALNLHTKARFDVPRSWLRKIDGMKVLAIERFDRKPDGQVLPQETFRSVIATGDKSFLSNEDVSMDELPRYLDGLAEICAIDVVAAKKELFRRYILAMLTGNGDLHLENISFITEGGATRLSPIYDPAPMRAWPQHDTRSTIPVDFEEGETWPHAIRRLGLTYGYTPAGYKQIVERALDDTKSYLAEVLDMQIDDARKKRLSEALPSTRKDVERSIPTGKKDAAAKKA